MATVGRKARALAEGAAIGGAETAAVVGGASLAMRGLAAVAPRAAAGVASAAGIAFAAPTLAAAATVGGIYGGVQAARHNGSTRDIFKATLGGAVSLGTNIASDAIMGVAHAAEGKKAKKAKKPTASAQPKAETPEQARERLGQRWGGSPKDLKLAAENDRANMATAKTQLEREAYERRALLAEQEYERQTGEHIGPTLPSTPAAAPKKGLIQQAHDLVFGEGGPKKEDALKKSRKELDSRATELRRQMEAELGGQSGQRGIGPNYRALQTQLDKVEAERKRIGEQQAAKENEELAAYRQIGAYAVGGLIGGALGMRTEAAAEAAATAAGKSVAKLARTAVAAVKASPRGVIAGTVQGDKAAAAVSVAKAAAEKRVVSGVEAFGLPAFNLAHGAAAITYGNMDKDNPASPLYRMEGAGAIAAGVLGAKYGLAAYAMRAKIPHELTGKLEAAASRLSREVRGGPGGVAQARGRMKLAKASGAAGVAQERARRDVTVAAGSRQRAAITQAGKGEAAKVSSKIPVVEAGSKLATTKVKGAARVERAEINAKASNSRAIDRNNVDIKYKDVWQDKRGRTYHRKDMQVRTRKGKAMANDNHEAGRRSA